MAPVPNMLGFGWAPKAGNPDKAHLSNKTQKTLSTVTAHFSSN